MLSKILNLIIALLLLAVLFIAIDASIDIWGGKEDVKEISIERLAGPERGGIFTDFIFSFELLSLLLIAALIGALYIAKKEGA